MMISLEIICLLLVGVWIIVFVSAVADKVYSIKELKEVEEELKFLSAYPREDILDYVFYKEG